MCMDVTTQISGDFCSGKEVDTSAPCAVPDLREIKVRCPWGGG